MRFILGLIIGIAAGAALGLLVAPQSGKETRAALSRQMHHEDDGSEDETDVG